MRKSKFKDFFKLDNFFKDNKDVNRSNAKIGYKLVTAFVVIGVFYLNFIVFNKNLEQKESLFYIIIAHLVALLILHLILSKIKFNCYESNRTITVVTYSFIIINYIFGIAYAFFTVEYPAVFLPLTLLCFPLIFNIEPKMTMSIGILTSAVHLTLTYFKNHQFFYIDLLTFLGIVTSYFFMVFYMTNIKKEEFILRQKYKHLSGVDELTELANRRMFNITFEKNFYKYLNEKKTIALFLIDIDDFKNYNDFYGHLGGDDCLRRVGRFFKRLSAENDKITFYRYGGEEFVGVAYKIDRQQAEEIAVSIVQGVRDLNIHHLNSPYTKKVTVSVGIAVQYPNVMTNSSDFINLADKALYKVKAAGKNSYRFFD